jgi:hypothetical protein
MAPTKWLFVEGLIAATPITTLLKFEKQPSATMTTSAKRDSLVTCPSTSLFLDTVTPVVLQLESA